MGMKFRVEGVSNGYILYWEDYGRGMMSEPYVKETLVFMGHESLLEYLKKNMEIAEQE
jgi:hypothetical protein